MSVRSGSSRSGSGSGRDGGGGGSDSSRSSPSSDMPSSSFDGTHLSWRSFRSEVLAPHRIQVLDAPPKERIPSSFIAIVEAAMQDTTKFDDQKTCFWNQVKTGRGFGPSPLFPPNLLPPIDQESRLARCMVPSLSREALPDRAINQLGPLYELSLPRPVLGCGFSASAFTIKELATLPQWLHASGTVVHFDTGYVSPSATMYCPFLTFERAFGNREHRVESANNQCAKDGAYTTRALQMLYVKAWKGKMMPELPVSFSCTIDNSFALLNLHWIDRDQTYCMAPLCQFDLSKDAHFNKFLVWTQAIGEWALNHVLPLVKEAIMRLQTTESIPQIIAPNNPRMKLRVDTGINNNELLMSSLKTTFENIPWRFDDEEFTPVSSSTASWGSPMVNEQTFANLSYPAVHPPRSTTLSAAALARKRLAVPGRSPITPPPAYPQNADLALQKRFTYAMDEIRELQQQILAMKSDFSVSHDSLKKELLSELQAPQQQTESIEKHPATIAVSLPQAVIPKPPTQASYLTVLQFSVIMQSGQYLASLIPNTACKFLAFGVVTNVCLLTFITPVSLATLSTRLSLCRLKSWHQQ
ncbi:hypothetical protein LTR84_012144 [Exophiala bonariae]|uniref:DUF7924 domain-containing protein n=1 Tax=Exophiala bonariae TaxID=1690606 RepID=A0AAV9NFB0_9EURO|nr:hypothetical protein LTR84_012144 [Exophiala bonariae]